MIYEKLNIVEFFSFFFCGNGTIYKDLWIKWQYSVYTLDGMWSLFNPECKQRTGTGAQGLRVRTINRASVKYVYFRGKVKHVHVLAQSFGCSDNISPVIQHNMARNLIRATDKARQAALFYGSNHTPTTYNYTSIPLTFTLPYVRTYVRYSYCCL